MIDRIQQLYYCEKRNYVSFVFWFTDYHSVVTVILHEKPIILDDLHLLKLTRYSPVIGNFSTPWLILGSIR